MSAAAYVMIALYALGCFGLSSGYRETWSSVEAADPETRAAAESAPRLVFSLLALVVVLWPVCEAADVLIASHRRWVALWTRDA